MKLIIDGNKFKMAKITGPSHNFLSLVLSENVCDRTFVCDLNRGDVAPSISPNAVLKQVHIGLQLINKRLSANYSIKKIEFSSGDTYSNDIYINLTKNIIKEVDEKKLL